MEEVRILQSSAMGYGNVSAESIRHGLEWDPHVIVGQGTSTDPGPYYMGSDSPYPYVGKANKKRDISLILSAARQNDIPFIFSGGSPAGTDVQLEGILRIVDEYCREQGIRLRIAVISGELDKSYITRVLKEGRRATRLVDVDRLPRELTPEAVEECKRIVAQMGPEPVMEGLKHDVDGVITGRALDIGLYMAYPLLRGFSRSVSAHMAKTIECGALCAEPATSDNMFAFLRSDHFLVKPPNPNRRCTVASVAAHAFYERPDITREMNPGGYLDVSEAKFEQVDERTVKVSGGRWVDMPYTIKLEGVKMVGYRTISLAGIRDPNFIRELSGVLEQTRHRAMEKFGMPPGECRISFKVYGQNAVLGNREPERDAVPHEVGVLVDVIAPSQALATSVCAYIRGQLLFADFPGRTSTAGNIAVPFSPGEVEMGPAYEWAVWHALPLDDPVEPFPVKIVEFPRRSADMMEVNSHV